MKFRYVLVDEEHCWIVGTNNMTFFSAKYADDDI